MTLLIVGLVIFFAIHSLAIVAPAARERAVAAMGVMAWRGVYSVVSLVGFVLLVKGYGEARMMPTVLYAPPLWMRHVTFLLMLPVFPLIIAAYLPGRIKARLKHPMLVAIKTWALAHLLSNGNLADVLLFGGFLAWAVLDRISLKHRVQKMMISAPPKPVNDVIAVVAGLALYAVMLLWLHRVLIGVPLM